MLLILFISSILRDRKIERYIFVGKIDSIKLILMTFKTISIIDSLITWHKIPYFQVQTWNVSPFSGFVHQDENSKPSPGTLEIQDQLAILNEEKA